MNHLVFCRMPLFKVMCFGPTGIWTGYLSLCTFNGPNGGLGSLLYPHLTGRALNTVLACSANDSKYGLQAGVFTHDLDKAWYAFEKLDVGGVVVGHVPSIRVDAQVSSHTCALHPLVLFVYCPVWRMENGEWSE